MSTENDTVPAAETEIAERTTPLSDIFRNETDRHEREFQVGEGPQDAASAADAAPALAPAAQPSAQPAPQAETPNPDPAAKPEKEQPFWYRKEIEKERKARQAAEQRARDLEARGPQPTGPTPSDEDLDRPLTIRELSAYNERQALIGRLERSEERFVDKHGDETFEQTREWLATRPDIEEWALKQRDPWAAAHSQFNKERLASEIGEDPNAWRERERERIRAEILAEQQQDRPAPPAAPQMRSAPPPPASTARSAAPRDASGRFTGPAPIGSTFKHKL